MSTPAGWYPDPTGRHDHRWFNGDDWTDQVADGQAVGTDPVHGGGPPAQTPATAAEQTVSVPTGGPPPGAPGTAEPVGAVGAGGAAPASAYVPPGSEVKGGKGKTVLIIAVVVVLVAVGIGVALSLAGGDDDGDDDASGSDASDEPADEPEDDPSASDLFDDMAGDDGSGGPAEPAEEPVEDAPEGEYPPEEIETFVGDCVGAGSGESFCRCVIDVLQQNVSYERYQEIDNEARTNPDAPVPQELTDAVNECT